MKRYILFILILSFFYSCKNNTRREYQPMVRNVSKPIQITNGLYNKHIAIWGSHGMYYDIEQKEWTWQRPCLFQTVEDLLAESYVLQYIVPMLENAGANVLIPRERDIQMNEIIIDNDLSTNNSQFRIVNNATIWTKNDDGFAHLKDYCENENPFQAGTFLQTETVNDDSESLCEWLPSIPEKGKYAVYVSYKSFPNSTEDALYSVYHTGGKTDFLVNQTMGGGTWIFLGYFSFEKGINENCKVTLSNKSSKAGKTITADAVKIGGGMGNIIRNNKTSSHPRYAEGARYWLQWAGMPCNIYNANDGQDDYKDDLQCRGLWVNYLSNGNNKKEKGLNIPVDLSIAIHTDAGVKQQDTIVGTLGIYSSAQSVYLARQIINEIVNDIQSKHKPDWTNRYLKKRKYKEVVLPKVPAVLIEMFSHQNIADMRLGLDPRFQFTVSRSIYKGILKYIANKYGYSYVVQALPIESFGINYSGDNKIKLSWKPTSDPQEPSAIPNGYLVYTRIDEGGFDNGLLITEQSVEMNIENDKVYGFKITAVNAGGESFPSEILTVCKKSKAASNALIVNCFDTVSAPTGIHSNDSTGFIDFGIPYQESFYFVGHQYDFNTESPWIDTTNPGFGASNRDLGDTIIAGNTFDYTHILGKTIVNNGSSYTSCSVKAFVNGLVDIKKQKRIYLILGRNLKIQKLMPTKLKILPTEVQTVLEECYKQGCEIYIGMDEG